MLKDVISFVSSRTGETNREVLLREINFAWKEFWNSDDIPNSLFEMTVKPFDAQARITLPHYVGKVRAVKQNWSRERISLYTPRPYYQDTNYVVSPWSWRILGTTPLIKSIDNATTLTVKIPKVENAVFTVTLQGPTDNAQNEREQITFQTTDFAQVTIIRPTDLVSVTKDKITTQNVEILNAAGEVISLIPNDSFSAHNTIVQIIDKCTCNVCTNCQCFDILYKKPCPYLYNDEDTIHLEEVLMAKTIEWMSLPKLKPEQQPSSFNVKAVSLLQQFNNNEVGIEKRMDIGRNPYQKVYSGHL